MRTFAKVFNLEPTQALAVLRVDDSGFPAVEFTFDPGLPGMSLVTTISSYLTEEEAEAVDGEKEFEEIMNAAEARAKKAFDELTEERVKESMSKILESLEALFNEGSDL